MLVLSINIYFEYAFLFRLVVCKNGQVLDDLPSVDERYLECFKEFIRFVDQRNNFLTHDHKRDDANI